MEQNLLKKELKLDFKLYIVEWILLLASLFLLGFFIIYVYIIEKDRALQGEEDRLYTQSKIIHDNVSMQLYSVNEALRVIRTEIEYSDLTNVKDINHIEENLRLFVKVLPILRTFIAFDKDGNILVSNRDDIPRNNYSNRDYFKTIKNDPSAEKLYISAPFKTVLDVWTINVSLMLRDHKGNFAGIILAGIEPKLLDKLLNSVFYAKDMRASIIHGDGTLFLMTPDNLNILGKNLDNPKTLLFKHKNSGAVSNTFSDTTYITKDKRVVSFYTVNLDDIEVNTPLYIVVSREYDILFARIKDEFFIFLSLFFIISFVSTIGLYLYQKRRYQKDLKDIKKQKAKEARLKSFAYIDSLTQIANRRYFEKVFEQEWKYCLRNSKNISIIMIDIDYFKNYNDFYGHQAGDECLKQVAQVLKNSLNRSHDLMARYGGEEFVCILPDTDYSGATKMAEILRQNIKSIKIPHKKSKINSIITVSIGASLVIPNDKLTSDSLLKKADEALYKSKELGRDRVTIEVL